VQQQRNNKGSEDPLTTETHCFKFAILASTVSPADAVQMAVTVATLGWHNDG